MADDQGHDVDITLPDLSPHRRPSARRRQEDTSTSSPVTTSGIPNATKDVVSTNDAYPGSIPIRIPRNNTGRIKKSSTGSDGTASTLDDSPPERTPPTPTIPNPPTARSRSHTFRSTVKYYHDNITSSDESVRSKITSWIAGASQESVCQSSVQEVMQLVCDYDPTKIAGLQPRQNFSLDNIAVEGGCGLHETEITKMLHDLRRRKASSSSANSSSSHSDKSALRVPDHAIIAAGDHQSLLPPRRSNRGTASSGSRSTTGTPSNQARKRKRQPSDAIEDNTFCACGLLAEDKPEGGSATQALGQTLCYSVAGYEMCGCKLGLVVVGATFTRLVVKDDRTIYIESKNSDYQSYGPISISEYIKKLKEYQHFHALGSHERRNYPDGSQGHEFQLNNESIDRFIGIIKKGFECLMDLNVSGIRRNDLISCSYDFAETWRPVGVESQQDRATIIAAARSDYRPAARAKFPALGHVFPVQGKKDQDDDKDGSSRGQGGNGAGDPPSGSGAGGQNDAGGSGETRDDSNHQGGSAPGGGPHTTQAGNTLVFDSALEAYSEDIPSPQDEQGSTDEDDDGDDEQGTDEEERYFAIFDRNFEALSLLNVSLVVVDPVTMDKLVKSVSTSQESQPMAPKVKMQFHNPLHSYLPSDIPQFGR